LKHYAAISRTLEEGFTRRLLRVFLDLANFRAVAVVFNSSSSRFPSSALAELGLHRLTRSNQADDDDTACVLPAGSYSGYPILPGIRI